jgi:hypothetical protein
MGFKGTEGEKIIYTCDKCKMDFQFGPHLYNGGPGPNGTMLCKHCRPDPSIVRINSKD